MMINWKAPNNLNNLKSRLDKLNVHKLLPVPVDLSKLSDAIKKDACNTKIKKLNIKYLTLLT